MALPKLSEEGDALYTSMVDAANESEEGLRKAFFQGDLSAFTSEAAKTVGALMLLVQELTDHALLRTSKLQGSLCWSTRPREAAKSIRTLNDNERIVYEYVEDAHQKGIWVKDIKKRSNVHPDAVDKAIRKLEGTRLIKSVRNVRSPAQKTYILAHLAPSEDVTGGSFFDDGDLDESLVDELCNLIVFHVRQNSWVESYVRRPVNGGPAHAMADDTDSAAFGKRRRDGSMDDIEDSSLPTPSSTKRRRRSSGQAPEGYVDQPVQLAYPAHTHNYPTVEAIHAFITGSEVVRAVKAQQLTVAEIQNLIDVLIWDDKVEKVGGGYRTIRGVLFKQPGTADVSSDEEDEEDEDGVYDRKWWKGNGLTQAPCGRCPVADLCSESGPINASSCTYFKRWLDDEE